MSNQTPDNKVLAYITLGLAGVGLLIALVTGFGKASILGGIISAIGIAPASLGMWKGMQQETQHALALSIVSWIVAFGVGAALVVIGILRWVV